MKSMLYPTCKPYAKCRPYANGKPYTKSKPYLAPVAAALWLAVALAGLAAGQQPAEPVEPADPTPTVEPAPQPPNDEAGTQSGTEVAGTVEADTEPAAQTEDAEAPLLDLDALAPASAGTGLLVDLQAQTLHGLPAGMAAMIMGGGQSGQITQVPLAVPVLVPESGNAAVALLVEIDGPSLFGPSPDPEPEVQLFAYALTADDAVAGFLAQSVSLDLTEIGEAAFAGGLKLVGHLELPPGDYTLRVLVHEPTSQRFGLSVLPVTVPSGPALSTPLVEEPEEAPWLLIGEAPHGAMGALDLGRVLSLAGTGMPTTLPLLRGSEATFDALLYGAAGRALPDSVSVEVEGGEGSEGTAGPLTARVVSREATRLPGVERLRLGLPLEGLNGGYRLRFRLGDAAPSPLLPVVVIQGADTVGLWTEIERRRSGGGTVTVDMSEVDRRRRGRQRRAREAVSTAYRQVLARLANGEREEAVANLMQIEKEVLESGQEEPMTLLAESETLVLRALAAVEPQALLPVMMVHGQAYDRYLTNLDLGLSTYSRQTAISILELYARSVEDRWRRQARSGRGGSQARAEEEIASARRIASEALASFGAYLQSAQVRMGGRALLRRALELDPNNSYALLHLGAGLEKMGEYGEAVNVLDRLVQVDPKSPEGRLRLAVNHRRLENRGQSVEILRRIIGENNPDWVLAIAYQELATLHLEDGRAGDAVALLDQAVGRLPDQGRLRVQLAYALDRAGQTDRSRQVVARMSPQSAGGASKVVVVDDGGPGAAPLAVAGSEDGSTDGSANGSEAADATPALLAVALAGDEDDGASPRHRYNRWPRSELTGGQNSLAQAAMARLPALGAALEALPDAAELEDFSPEEKGR